MTYYLSMSWWQGSATDNEVTMLRRRVRLLEEQVAALAAFTGIDPHHLPREVDPVSREARQLVEEGKFIAAIKVHRQQHGLDLVTAKRDIDAVRAQVARH